MLISDTTRKGLNMLPASEWTVEGGRFLPQAYVDMSLHINEMYTNLEIGMLRNDAHINEEAKDHPFCLMMINGDGSVKPVKYLKVEEMSLGYILWWIDKNGTKKKSADEHFKEYLNDLVAQQTIERKAREEQSAEEADLLTTIHTSPLHTFRHNGNKIGADNNVPTLMKKEKEYL